MPGSKVSPIMPNPFVRDSQRIATHGHEPTSQGSRRGPGVYEGFVEPGPGVVLVDAGPQYRGSHVDPKAFFAPGRTQWTAQERLSAFGTAEDLSVGDHRLAQSDYAAVVLVNPSLDSPSLTLTATVRHDRPQQVTLVDPAGQPVDGVETGWFRSYGEPEIPFRTASFPLLRQPLGLRRRILFYQPEHKLTGFLMTDPTAEPTVTVKMRPWGTLTGQLLDETGQPLAGPTREHPAREQIMFSLFWTDPNPDSVARSWPEYGYRIKIEPDGRFRIERLIPGLRYHARVYRGFGMDAGPAFENIVLQPGEVRALGEDPDEQASECHRQVASEILSMASWEKCIGAATSAHPDPRAGLSNQDEESRRWSSRRNRARNSCNGCSTRGVWRDWMDASLVDRFAISRDPAAFAALVARHGPMVQAVCRGIGGLGGGEDAFQATFIVLLNRIGTFPVQGSSLAGWLFRVARRVSRQARIADDRRRRRERVAAKIDQSPQGHDPEQAEILALIRAEVDRLPERYRVPIVLCDLEGLTREEAAVLLGCPAGTVGARVARGRQRLRDRLARRGLAPSVVWSALSGGGSVGVGPDRGDSIRLATGDRHAGQRPPPEPSRRWSCPVRSSGRVNSARLWSRWRLSRASPSGGRWCRPRPSRLSPPIAQQTSPPPPPTTPIPPPTPADPDDPALAGRFAGRVVGPDGAPLAGAEVFLTHSGSPAAAAERVRAVSGADGRFVFDAPDMTYLAVDGAPARRVGKLSARRTAVRRRLDHHLGADRLDLPLAFRPGQGGRDDPSASSATPCRSGGRSATSWGNRSRGLWSGWIWSRFPASMTSTRI